MKVLKVIDFNECSKVHHLSLLGPFENSLAFARDCIFLTPLFAFILFLGQQVGHLYKFQTSREREGSQVAFLEEYLHSYFNSQVLLKSFTFLILLKFSANK